jgi:ABC-type amino acid transport substrate-binding protein
MPVQAQTQAPSRAEAVRARGELRVCIWPDYFAITWRNPRNDELAGIDIDLARDLARRLGVQPVFVETNFRDFMGRLEQGTCDVAMFGIGVTPQRAARVEFARPYLSSAVYAVTTRDNPVITRWEDIDRPGNSVAVAASTYMEPLMRQTLRHASLVSLAPPQTREAELQSGRVDVFMSDFPYTRRMVMAQEWVRIIEPPKGFGETRYAHAVAKGDPAWLAVVDGFVAAAREDGTLARAAERNGLAPILLR